MRCFVSSMRRSTCSSSWSARSAPSWARSTTSRIFRRWCSMPNCRAPRTAVPPPSPRWKTSFWRRDGNTPTPSNWTRRCSGASWMPLEEGRMHGFVADLLAEDGALVEALEPDGLEAVVPPGLQQALGVGEFCRFGFGSTLPEGAQRVGIESDWLARFERVVAERGRWNRLVVDPGSRKAPDAESLLEKELGLENATYRLLDVAPAWTRYLVLDFRFTALSDEKRAGTQRLAINLATGAMAEGMLRRLADWPVGGLADGGGSPR